MSRRPIRTSRALVTGASSGIGRAVVLELVRHGAAVLATARREHRLCQLVQEAQRVGGRVEILADDLTDPATRHALIQTAQDRLGGLDILVNNAGIGAHGLFEDAQPDVARQLMELNFLALVDLTRLALPLLKQGRRPMVVNIASVLGHRGVPERSLYCATKAAVRAFSEALRAEWKRHGISVLVVSPGLTETEFPQRVIQRTGPPKAHDFPPVSAHYVARKTVQAICRDRHEIVPYFWGKVFIWLNRLSPRLVDWLLFRRAVARS